MERAEARRLRREDGASVKAIARKLSVSPSSVSRWVRDIPLSAEQIAALAVRDPRAPQQQRSSIVRRAKAQEVRARWQEEGRELARAGDPLHHAGCMLYWAEGTKNRNRVCLVNADVPMLQLFARFLRECYGATDDRLAFSVNCYLGNGKTLEEIEAFWLDALALPPSSLRAAAVNRPSSASKRKGRVLVYGTGRLVLHSTAVAQSIYGAIQEYGGFERPEWLG